MLIFYSACKKATVTVFISGEREYPAVGFEYKMASDGHLVAEISSKQFYLLRAHGFQHNTTLHTHTTQHTTQHITITQHTQHNTTHTTQHNTHTHTTQH